MYVCDGSYEVTLPPLDPTQHQITQRLHALTFLVPAGPAVCDSFCPPCSRCWLAIISGCVLCYRRAAEPSHNNSQTEASHALRPHDSNGHQWLAYIQLAQLLLDWQPGFLVFARSSVLLGTCTEWQNVFHFGVGSFDGTLLLALHPSTFNVIWEGSHLKDSNNEITQLN